jgi:hypothetical protein
MADTGDKIIRVYSDFRGVDYRGDECALNRSPDALNVWRDYRELTGIKTRPALNLFVNNNEKKVIDMVWHNGNAGDDGNLYFIDKDGYIYYVDYDEENKEMSIGGSLFEVGTNSFFFEFGGKLYAIGNKSYVNLTDGEEYGFGGEKTEPFVPITSIGAAPDGTGRQTYQDVNMLTPYRKNTFCGDYYNPKDYPEYDGTYSSELHLDAEEIDEDADVYITIDGVSFKVGDDVPESLREYFTLVEVDYKGGIVSFYSGGSGDIGSGKLPAPQTVGRDNITVKFRKSTGTVNAVGQDDNARKILGCTIVEQFDNRIFVSGNPNYPNLVFHSSLENPTYFSDLDVYQDGKDDGYIRAMVSGNDALWVFRNTDKGNGVYYHTASFDSTYGKVYPSVHSNISLGCVGGAINFLDDVVFFSRQGMEGISQNITTEQFAKHKSSLVDRVMANKDGYEDMVFAEWEGYLLVFIGADVFLADSRAVMSNEGHYEYEWYHWKLFIDTDKGDPYDRVTCATVHDGNLYIGTEGGFIYTFDKNSANGDEYYSKNDGVSNYTPIESYWTTPKDKFASSNKLKTTNKKGCIVEAEGDLTVSSKVEGGDFDDAEEYTGIKDHIVPKIKRKKFKDIQLKFHSNTKFKLESATLEAFVGSYIKK